MPRDRQAQFEEKRALVALFREQVALLRESDPEGIGRHFGAINFARYDDLLAQGPAARWPAGYLPGLREGIRDMFTMLDMAYRGEARRAANARLRAVGGAALDVLLAREVKQLAAVRKRGRIRTEAEYHLVRDAVDRAEGAIPRDDGLLQELWGLVDRASASD